MARHCPPSDSPDPGAGVLITNIGTPAAPTPAALRRYLAEFLGDRRVVELPRGLWQPILHLVLLNFRPRRSARLYQRVWTEDGSPLLVTVRAQAAGLQERLGESVRVAIGMRYGQPSIAAGLRDLRAAGARRILVFPLFPQYSATTTAATFDAVFDELKRWRWLPELRTVAHYSCQPGYIQALAESIGQQWRAHGQPERLLFSFHGIPQSYSTAGDPYAGECRATAGQVAEQLGLRPEQWALAFQSRFGPVEWLRPYTDEVLTEWGRARVGSVHVICPGFSADCLETIDEIGREGRHIFESAGGGAFHYIPALNAQPNHLDVLAAVARQQLLGWLDEAAPHSRLADGGLAQD